MPPQTRWGRALSIWNSDEQCLFLARDFIGTRPLFYCVDRRRVQWSSVLDPLVHCAGRSLLLDREYLAGWFGLFPASHLTPCVGIHSVPPASCVVVCRNSTIVRPFWQFAEKTISYPNDADYEEHFLELFERAVRRRLRSRFPVLAELSGGMDSSSIVCMADNILTKRRPETPRLDTISYYIPGEPNWNERPFISKVEERRGRGGSHIELSSNDAFALDSKNDDFMATPGALDSCSKSAVKFSEILRSNGSRVLLSGVGGDEVLGGAPSLSPMLADLLVKGHISLLVKKLIEWALVLRRPALSLLFEMLATFLRGEAATRSVPPPAWLATSFAKANSKAVRGYPRRTRVFGPRPSFQESLGTLEALRRQLCCYPLSAEPPYYKTYPYLDRNLLEFLFAVPPGQLVRPHQRRSLMRRALVRIVPEELLQRKRKAFVIREPLVALSSQYAQPNELIQKMLSASLRIVDGSALSTALNEVRAGARLPVT